MCEAVRNCHCREGGPLVPRDAPLPPGAEIVPLSTLDAPESDARADRVSQGAYDDGEG